MHEAEAAASALFKGKKGAEAWDDLLRLIGTIGLLD